MLGLLINLIITFLVLGVAWWVITLLPPFGLVIQVVFVLIALILVIDLLLGLAGGAHRPLLWRG